MTRGTRDAPTVTMTLLGDFSVEVDGTPVPPAWSRRNAAALVKLLALTPGRRLHRERVIDALWPGLTLDEASPRLHKAAYFARKALGRPDAVVLEDELVALLPEADVAIDVPAFEGGRVRPGQRFGGRGERRAGRPVARCSPMTSTNPGRRTSENDCVSTSCCCSGRRSRRTSWRWSRPTRTRTWS